jgi:hypothetical protein
MIDLGTGVSIAVLSLVAGGYAWLWMRFDSAMTRIDEHVDAVAQDLTSFKLEANRTFATPGAIEKSEERLTIAIDRMTARLETIVGRIENLTNEVTRLVAVQNRGKRPSIVRDSD